jgi:CRP-like cAMP-binding protein
MDHHLLLTAVTLHLAPEVRSGQAVNGVFTIKNPAAHTYLRVTKADWSVLEQFAQPAKVPDVLRTMLEERTCPPLRDFYEVVLKAHREGMLCAEAEDRPAANAVRWFGIGAGWPVKLGWLAAVAAMAVLFLPGYMPSLVPLDLLKGWGIWCGALSLGQMLAASAVAGAEGRVYRPHLAWLTWTPHVAFDLRDASLGARHQQLAALWSRLLPPALAVSALVALRPEWALPAVVGWLWLVRPVFGGAIGRIVELMVSRLRPDTKRDYLFEANRGLYARHKAAVRSTPTFVALLSLAYGVLWVAVVTAFVVKVNGYLAAPWWRDLEFWKNAGMILAVWVGGVVALLVLLEIAWWCWRRWKALRAHLGTSWRRRRYHIDGKLDERALLGHVLKTPLYRRLTPEQQGEVVRRLVVRQVPAGTVLDDFDEEPSVVGLIISGEAKQHRHGPTGHIERVGRLAEYELFGAHRVADPKRRVRTRARTRLCYLALPIEEFRKLVVEPLGVQAVEQSAVRHPFLRRLSLCAHWHPQALARFVQLTTPLDCNEGDLIIRKGEDTRELFIVQEGRVEVILGKRRRRVLKPGAFFGEIGLLQNSRIVADVKARTIARCLAINKRDFLRFMTHNPSVGLQVERISSERLGRPIFPLSRQSFDIR